MENIYLSPFWEGRHDSSLALIDARRAEHRAESRLVKRRLKRISIEHRLYTSMGHRVAYRLRKADAGVGNSTGVLRTPALTPAGKTFDGKGKKRVSDVSSLSGEKTCCRHHDTLLGSHFTLLGILANLALQSMNDMAKVVTRVDFHGLGVGNGEKLFTSTLCALHRDGFQRKTMCNLVNGSAGSLL